MRKINVTRDHKRYIWRNVKFLRYQQYYSNILANNSFLVLLVLKEMHEPLCSFSKTQVLWRTNQVNRQTVRARPLTWQGKDPLSHIPPQWHSPVTNVYQTIFVNMINQWAERSCLVTLGFMRYSLCGAPHCVMAFIRMFIHLVFPAPLGPRAIIPWRTRWVS